MSDRHSLPYRPCVGIMLLDRRGHVFIGRRAGSLEAPSGAPEWQMPQGGIDAGEAPLAAATRELYEETNVTSAELLAEAPDWFAYDIPDDIAGKGWTRKYRGQTQKWFAFRFTGEEGEIDVRHPAGGAQKAEFGAWRWEAMDMLPALIVAFKRPVYEEGVAAFRHLAP